MAEKNGGKWKLSFGDTIKIVVIVVGGLVFYFRGFAELQTVTVKLTTIVEQQQKTLEKHEEKIDKLFEVKADKE